MMGTKGRDVIAWLIYAGIFVLAILLLYPNQTASIILFYFTSILLVLFGFHIFEIHRAKKQSKKMGLEIVVLIPLFPKWAEILVSRYLRCSAINAYEIHLRDTKKKPKELLRAMEKDLAYIENNLKGLFLWETGITVPRRIRQIIKDYKSKGLAIWEDGMLLIPSPPFVGRKHRKRFKRGVIKIE